MTDERKREVIEYFNTCEKCGEEFVVDEGSTQMVCYGCQSRAARASAKERLKRFIGAKIINIEPVCHGSATSSVELEYVEVKLGDGEIVRFTPNCLSGEVFIDWDEL